MFNILLFGVDGKGHNLFCWYWLFMCLPRICSWSSSHWSEPVEWNLKWGFHGFLNFTSFLFVLFSFFILCFLGCIPLFSMRNFECIIVCASPYDNDCWNFDAKAWNALHRLRHGLPERWWIRGLSFLQFWIPLILYNWSLSYESGLIVRGVCGNETSNQMACWILRREYPIVWSCQDDLRYATSSTLENWCKIFSYEKDH